MCSQNEEWVVWFQPDEQNIAETSGLKPPQSDKITTLKSTQWCFSKGRLVDAKRSPEASEPQTERLSFRWNRNWIGITDETYWTNCFFLLLLKKKNGVLDFFYPTLPLPDWKPQSLLRCQMYKARTLNAAFEVLSDVFFTCLPVPHPDGHRDWDPRNSQVIFQVCVG